MSRVRWNNTNYPSYSRTGGCDEANRLHPFDLGPALTFLSHFRPG